MLSRLLLTVLFLGVFCGGRSYGQERPRPQDDDYRKLANGIIDEIVQSKHMSVALTGLDATKHVHRSADRIYVHLYYSHGVIGDKPNPDYRDGKKVSQTLPIYRHDGVQLGVHLFTGLWEGAEGVIPLEIGQLKIVIGADGPRGFEVEHLMKSIIERKKAEFLKSFQL